MGHEREPSPNVPFCYPHDQAKIRLDELARRLISVEDDELFAQIHRPFPLCTAAFNLPGQVLLFSNRKAIDAPDLSQVEAHQLVESLVQIATGDFCSSLLEVEPSWPSHRP